MELSNLISDQHKWLLTGKGSMLRDGTAESVAEAVPKEKIRTGGILHSGEGPIEALKGLSAEVALVQKESAELKDRLISAQEKATEAFEQLAECRNEVIRLERENAPFRTLHPPVNISVDKQPVQQEKK